MISLRSKMTQAILRYFMLHEGAELYMNEMARRLSLDDGNLSRKLNELEKEGILKSREAGKERYYSLNRAYPLLKEYRQIILKTVGIEKSLKEALQDIAGLKEAYLFGSYAKNQMTPSSDIDLMVVGDHDTLEVQKKVSQIQKTVDREINVVSLSQKEYQKRLKEDPFIRSLQTTKKIRLI